jgi:predicted transcriptional regulator of viral defense system
MNSIINDLQLIEKYQSAMHGIFSIADLKNLFLEPDPVAANRRIGRLVANNVLFRFTRGFYVTEAASLERLAVRIHENSYISCASALAHHLMTGTVPSGTVYSVKPGRPVTYQGKIGKVIYLGIKEDLFFGYSVENGLRIASPEKALIDTLYFYQKGRTYYFNIYADIIMSPVNKKLVREYLGRYKNPRFTAFVERYLDEKDR